MQRATSSGGRIWWIKYFYTPVAVSPSIASFTIQAFKPRFLTNVLNVGLHSPGVIFDAVLSWTTGLVAGIDFTENLLTRLNEKSMKNIINACDEEM